MESDPFEGDDIDNDLSSDEAESLATLAKNVEEQVENKPPTREELLKRLKDKRHANSRQTRIKNYQDGKQSASLTRIYFCENRNCVKIFPSKVSKVCSVCKVFTYCSVECQTSDWAAGHRFLCGKTSTADELEKRQKYIKANEAAIRVEKAACYGKHMTVIHEKNPNAVACIFSTIAAKSNVLHFSEYVQHPIFTTSDDGTLGDFSLKVDTARTMFPLMKVFIISVVLDRVKKDENTACVVRMYIGNGYGEIIKADQNGKLTKTVKRYQKVSK